MAHTTVDAIFEGGAFRPQHGDELKFSEGQRVTLTIETVSSAEPLSATLDNDLSLLPRSTWELRRQTLHQRPSLTMPSDGFYDSKDITDPELRSRLAGLESRTDRKPSRMERVLDGVNETLEFWTQGPKEIRDWIKREFRKIVTEVRDIQPVEPNKVQTTMRDGLAYFNNVSSLCIYVILIAAALKVIFLFAGQSTRIVQAFENIKFLMTPINLALILICLLMIGGLQKISRFVKSYRVMSILGCAIAIKVMIKTSIVLFTATSFNAMGAAAWELFAGALK